MALERAHGLLQAAPHSAGEIHHRLHVATVHDREQIGGRGDDTNGLALPDTTRAARAEREVRVDVNHGKRARSTLVSGTWSMLRGSKSGRASGPAAGVLAGA